MAKEKTLTPVRPNLGIEEAYRKRLDKLIAEMNASVDWWVKAAFRANTPEMAQDASPAKTLQGIIAKLGKRWQGRFDEEAPNLAKWFTSSVQERADKGMQNSLKNAGFSVKFTMTRAMNDIVQATTAENVSLIKSISSQYFTDIEGLVMRSVAQGRDLGGLATDLQDRYKVTRRRAELISKTENTKATSNMMRARQKELGITEAQWVHSAGGRHPRKSHVEASGKTYNIDEGMKIDGEFIFPGQLINCRCVSRSLIKGFNA